jgi:hypothetical protein
MAEVATVWFGAFIGGLVLGLLVAGVRDVMSL